MKNADKLMQTPIQELNEEERERAISFADVKVTCYKCPKCDYKIEVEAKYLVQMICKKYKKIMVVEE